MDPLNSNKFFVIYCKVDFSHQCPGCCYPICSEELCHPMNREFHEKHECNILKKLGNNKELEALGETLWVQD